MNAMIDANDIISEIAERLGVLTRCGVLTHDDSIGILKLLSEKQYIWMEDNFSTVEISEFLNRM